MITRTRQSIRYSAPHLLCAACLAMVGLQPGPALAQEPTYVGLGDSIGEGVQSGDASFLTQPHSYHALFARKLGASFSLPYIASTPFGVVGDTVTRRRFQPSVSSHNLSVSGQTVGALLRNRADAATTAEISGETDLVLFPRMGSQIEVVEGHAPGDIHLLDRQQ